MYIYQNFHTATCTIIQGGRTIDGTTQQGVQLPSFSGQPGLLFLLHLRQTHKLLQLGLNRDSRPTEKATRQHQRQPIIITQVGLNRISSDLSSVATPNRHHN